MIIGIDEVGRGPIAGPVCVAVFAVDSRIWLEKKVRKIEKENSRISAKKKKNNNKKNKNNRINKKDKKNRKFLLHDSKKLSPHDRETWAKIAKNWQKAGICNFAVTMVSAKIIDKIGIVSSINRALSKSLLKLETRIILKNEKQKNRKNKTDKKPKKFLSKIDKILLDGGLRAPAEYKNQKTIIKGDEKESVIALASIIAKVHRDKYMTKIAQKFPQYGFENHVGYGTSAHYLAIKKHGLTLIHRKSFLKSLH